MVFGVENAERKILGSQHSLTPSVVAAPPHLCQLQLAVLAPQSECHALGRGELCPTTYHQRGINKEVNARKAFRIVPESGKTILLLISVRSILGTSSSCF